MFILLYAFTFCSANNELIQKKIVNGILFFEYKQIGDSYSPVKAEILINKVKYSFSGNREYNYSLIKKHSLQHILGNSDKYLDSLSSFVYLDSLSHIEYNKQYNLDFKTMRIGNKNFFKMNNNDDIFMIFNFKGRVIIYKNINGFRKGALVVLDKFMKAKPLTKKQITKYNLEPLNVSKVDIFFEE